MKRYIRSLFLLIFAGVVLVWLVCFVKCEFLTVVYSKSFKRIEIEDCIMGDKFKVLHYSGEYAEVYYTGDKSELLTFRKHGDKWSVSSRRVVKYAEDSGAKIFVWPYFWHYLLTE